MGDLSHHGLLVNCNFSCLLKFSKSGTSKKSELYKQSYFTSTSTSQLVVSSAVTHIVRSKIVLLTCAV